MVGDLPRAVVGTVAHRDTGLAEGLDVNVIETDGGLHHDPALVEQRQELGRWCHPHDAVAVAPLFLGDVAEAARELGDDTIAHGLLLDRVIATAARPE